MRRRTASLSFFAAFLALIIGLWAPTALARHSDEHDRPVCYEAGRSRKFRVGKSDFRHAARVC